MIYLKAKDTNRKTYPQNVCKYIVRKTIKKEMSKTLPN